MAYQIREDRKPQGRKKLTAERSAYFQLMQQGYSNREACRIVGVSPRPGKVWRNGRHAHKGLAKARPLVYREPSSPGPGRYLRESERIHIADRLREKASVRTIVAELGRSPSTVSREIRRNGTPLRRDGSGWACRPRAARARADACKPCRKPGRIGQNRELRGFIQDRLARRWSPEQICPALRAVFPDRPEMYVTHETLYQALYVQGRGELRWELTRALRTGRVMRRPHRQFYKRQPRMSADMVMISERPAEVADRAVPGRWEGDLIIGKEGKSAIATLVEGSTRYVLLAPLPKDHSAVSTRDALIEAVTSLPQDLKRSLIWDQGSEMAARRAFTIATDIPVYFCAPGSPWQRGSNENTNGLLRQYFPKGTDLSPRSREHLAAVAVELNSRPRKALSWETPAERLQKLLAA
ncbi:integrase [Streptomyces corchorusii]|uniref:Integrase n=2 Tax=Streptomyces TaxID=1883 RepID=A0A117Q8V3_STRCK|nr:IS30 family transposase [Streptomyces corchorusii]KUN15014.1 integrase [Streptomyces corchorusii]